MRGDIKYSNVIDSDQARLAQAAADLAPQEAWQDIDPDRFFITQRYERYAPDDHRVWGELVDRRMKVLRDQAHSSVLANGHL